MMDLNDTCTCLKTIFVYSLKDIKIYFMNWYRYTLSVWQVKLDLSETNDFGGGVDNRAGAFVMYNCARLATLFKHFTKAVEDGNSL